jgi:hypothetical protein
VAGPNCHNCIYSVCDPEEWLRLMYLGEPILPSCANHPLWPGQLHEVPGVPCRNYRRKSAAPQGDVRLIPLTDGFYAYVDAADHDWLNQWDWHSAGGYAARIEKGRIIYMHRQIMPPPPGKVVDHHDGNKANNCRCNLRICTPQQNRCNAPRKARGRCQFRGVYRDRRRGRIWAQIKCGGRYYWLGRFPTEAEAARAYDRAALEAFGEFARPNFPEEWPPERWRELHAQYLRTGKLSFARTPTPRRGKSLSARRRAKSSFTRERKKIRRKERKKNTRKTKVKHARRGESSCARTPVSPQRVKDKKITRKERQKDTHKGKAKANKKTPKVARKPHPARRKTNELPQRAQRTQRDS